MIHLPAVKDEKVSAEARTVPQGAPVAKPGVSGTPRWLLALTQNLFC